MSEVIKTPRKPRATKPKQSAVKLGVKQTARIASKRAIKSSVSSVQSPLAKLILTAALGAVAAYFINKE